MMLFLFRKRVICFKLLIIEGDGDGGFTLSLMILFLFRKGSILLVEETEIICENNQPATINVQMLSHKFF